MGLIRCSCQNGSKSLGDYYARVLKQPDADRMMSFFNLLGDSSSAQTVFWLLSHTKICLLSEDDHSATKWATVDVGYTPFGKFEIQCRVPDAIAPWSQAYVHGFADYPEYAVEMLLSGLEFSGGLSQ